MERLHRRSGFSATHEDHWKSFTDIFATVCLMFFFVLVVFGVLSSYLRNEVNQAWEDLRVREAQMLELLMNNEDLMRGRQPPVCCCC